MEQHNLTGPFFPQDTHCAEDKEGPEAWENLESALLLIRGRR